MLKKLQSEFPENIIGLPTRSKYGTQFTDARIPETETGPTTEYMRALDSAMNEIDELQSQGKIIYFNAYGYGQMLNGANEDTTFPTKTKPTKSALSVKTFDYLSNQLLNRFGFLNPNYLDKDVIAQYQNRKVITAEDIYNQIQFNPCFSK